MTAGIRTFYAKIKFGISARFFCEKRDECGNLSVKMDSRFRGNDGGNPHIFREKLILEFPQNDRKKAASFPAAFFLPKLKPMNRVYLESGGFGKVVCVFPFESGGGADLPIVITEFALQI